MMLGVLALRGFAAVLVLLALVGGLPRLVQLLLAAAMALWTALAVLPGAAAHVPLAPVSAVRELLLGATLGVAAAAPLLCAAVAGRWVDLAASRSARGPYGAMFGLLSGAVFVGIDGHVAAIRAIVRSHQDVPALSSSGFPPDVVGVVGVLAGLVPASLQLAAPWLLTAAVVQLAIGVGSRVGGRAVAHAPLAVGVPAALAMISASLVATLALAIAALVRGTLPV